MSEAERPMTPSERGKPSSSKVVMYFKAGDDSFPRSSVEIRTIKGRIGWRVNGRWCPTKAIRDRRIEHLKTEPLQ